LLALFPVFHLESRKQAFLCPNKTLQDKENMEEQMETYQELRTRQQKEVDALPLGFAFSEKQFEEMKAKLGVKENSELYRLGSTGGFYRKIDADLIIGTFKRHQEERQNAIFTANGINTVYVQSMIYYEMCNHEFAINHDGREEVLEACNLTEELLDKHSELKNAWNAARKQYYADAERNNWF
jgi:uncharacterized protein YaaQ